MKVPSIILFGLNKYKPAVKKLTDSPFLKAAYMPWLKFDSISFSSTAKYLKKYATLPDEIKNNLTPSDGIDMLKDMEMVAKGKIKRGKLEDNKSIVYVNPWLSDYYMMITKADDDTACAFYSEKIIADIIWEDKENPNMYLIKKNRQIY